ncbi:MAG: hypothetical protein K1000chlam4_00726 [Chlamydiae bacterium]|nr:hypothetical protein [Chlamydiota bacterium]
MLPTSRSSHSHQLTPPSFRAERVGTVALFVFGLILAACAITAQFQGLGSIGVAAFLGEAGISLVASIVSLAIIPRRKALPPPEPKKCDPESKQLSQASLELAALEADDLADPNLPHRAASRGSIHALHRAVSHPRDMTASLSHLDPLGDTPLHSAILEGHVATVQWLASTKVGMNQPNREGKSPLQQIAGLKACAHEDAKAMTEAMIEYGGDVTAADSSGNTLCHLAAMSDNSGTLEVLLQNNPKAAKSTNTGRDSPLRLAINHNSVEAIRLLVPYSIVTQKLCLLFKGHESCYTREKFNEINQLLTRQMEAKHDAKRSF